jgi:hypothetical protein
MRPARPHRSGAPKLARVALAARAAGRAVVVRAALAVTAALAGIALGANATAGAAPGAALAPLVSATIRPSRIYMGETAELTITSSGSSMAPVTLPEVPGLELRVMGQSHRVEIINGGTLVTTALIVRVTPAAPGTYTIPDLTPRSQPLVLRVDPESGTGRSSRFGNLPGLAAAPAATAAGKSAAARAEGIRLTADGSAFIRLKLPKKEIYVGESIPVDIEVGLRDGFVSSLNGLPTLTGGGDFTLNNLSHQPQRVQKLIDGKNFTLLIWHSAIAGVKPGQFALTVESPLTVRVRTRPQGESLLEDSLGDPFLQNYFGATVKKDITVASPTADLTVLALPLDGRPATFSGAVGSFKISDELSAPMAAAGDPLTLRLQITGSGNFDRVDSPMLEHLDAWKTYPPRSTFKASDAVGYQGSKLFEQPLIAARVGAQTLPALEFSYFDPNTRRYETARSAPVAVTIQPSLADRSLQAPDAVPPSSPGPPQPRPPVASTASRSPESADAASGLRPDHARDADYGSLLPLYLQPTFLALPTLLSLAFVATWFGLRRHAAPAGPSRGKTPKAVERTLRQIEAVARSGDAGAFFTAARSALLPCVTGRLDAEHDDIRRLFALADEANYAGSGVAAPDFEHWLRVVRLRLGAA